MFLFSTTLDDQNYSKAKNTDLIGGQTPQLIWFGNGEAKTVKIQFYLEQNRLVRNTNRSLG